MYFLKLRVTVYLNGKGESSIKRWTNSEQKQYRGKYAVLLVTTTNLSITYFKNSFSLAIRSSFKS